MRLLLALILTAVLAHPATWYVSTTGNDSTGNGTIGSPFRTIRKGMETMSGGDTLILRGGTYDEPNIANSLIKDGTIGNPTIIKSYPGERAIFRPNRSDRSGFYTANTRNGPNWLTLDGWTIDFSLKTSAGWSASLPNLKFYAARNITFTNMHFLNNTNGSLTQIYPGSSTFGPAGPVYVVSCTFSNVQRVSPWEGREIAKVHPIYWDGLPNSVIENNYFSNGESTAMTGKPGSGSTNWIVRNNWIENFDHGLRFDSERSLFYNNVVINCRQTGIGSVGVQNTYANNTVIGMGGKYGIRDSYLGGSWGEKFVNNVVWGSFSISGIGVDPDTGTGRLNYWTNNLAPSAQFIAGSVTSGNLIGTQYNPQFLNSPTDLRLSSSSPARGAGVALASLFTADFYGNARTTPWDLGAFVFNSQAPTEEDPPDPEPDPLPLVSVNALSEYAFENPVTSASFRITRTGSTSGAMSVPFSVSGDAVAGTHYVALSSPASLSNGVASTDITVTPLGGGGWVGAKSVTVTLSAGDYTLSSVTNATIQIIGAGNTAGGYRRSPGQGPAMFRRGNP